ncbi:uncharacterized protein A1O9_12583 [Exophiala aquamarina CBS 119918]|uniref:4-coumarate-CoA ligase n=1 Tax=Exophiala aquamarina CBS 119918 TaxID=1182545 RepID=A0A072NU92_9EURO|nr:uncharacterized protein A1O9_12583 [Exophiala aquamarina CBS 119918]KEF51434.1 hypothetical protein A1O9_12583 [Exophiala aquamarina CBS 119918]
MAPGEAASTTAFISFSSGTSGLVKGVKLSHSNVVANVFQMKQRLPEMYGNDTVSALVVPFFHILGLSGFCCQYLTMGVPIVVFERFEMEALLQSIKRDRITHLNIVPPLALQFLSDPLARKGDYSSIKALINAAAPLKQEIADKLSELMGCAVTQWYGMTEASPAVACQREGEVNVQNTVGKLHYGMALRIVDEEGNDCAEGEPGEFWITGPNIMQGYTTSEHRDVNGAFVNGYLKTGDIGYRDRAGFLYLLDRAKEMIKVKGNQVAPAELEAIILTHTAVSDAAVCGLEVVAEGTEYPVAYITTGVVGAKAQQDLIADVRKYVDSRVAGYKRLRGGVYIVSQIPRNPAGKILRRLLPANAAKTTAKAVKTGGSASKL